MPGSNLTIETTMSVDYLEIKETLVAIAKEAGSIIKERSARVAFDYKKNATDLVTEVDVAVEHLVSSKLRAKYPTYKFIGEESFAGTKLDNDPTFIVDPIDGTTNFIHFFPFSCISLGFAHNGKPMVGVVYSPFYDLLYSAVKGHGAYLGEVRLPLRTAPELTLQGSLVAIEWGADRSGNNFKVKTETYKSLFADESEGGANCHGGRSLGSAAMNLCSVAAGQLDCYWEGGCWAWDVCAGWIILEEAGGKMFSGNPGKKSVEVEDRIYLAVRGAAPDQQAAFVEKFWSHIKGQLKY